ncbi:hypothetical protein O6H91_05G127600 [Diphasiastrum complanatum]|uniref:Uncharacterized protein n=1 Tax=Diphasiastrum complanatum TaxID=34168 RepID=A0ACC2DTI9_DIPCM|nr:hypothetical protein O6H91_05G127600 [Diphasiastrum complanatum]
MSIRCLAHIILIILKSIYQCIQPTLMNLWFIEKSGPLDWSSIILIEDCYSPIPDTILDTVNLY